MHTSFGDEDSHYWLCHDDAENILQHDSSSGHPEGKAQAQ